MNNTEQKWASANLIFSDVTLVGFGDSKFDVYEVEDLSGYKHLAYIERVSKYKNGLYDSYIESHIDIPDSISKESPCYKQFMKEKEMNK